VSGHGADRSGERAGCQALHRLSPGQKGNFVALNCSSISETLAESELFGHVKGAFTGAHQDKVGVFEYADGGTALLDEIGEIAIAATGQTAARLAEPGATASGFTGYSQSKRSRSRRHEQGPSRNGGDKASFEKISISASV